MHVRLFLMAFVLLLACRAEEFSGIRQSGLREIKCPEFKAKKLRKRPSSWTARTPRKEDKEIARAKREQSIFRTKVEHLETMTNENLDLKPILHQVNIEDMDCPKPGMKKNVPKAVKQNIRKNHRKIRTYIKKRVAADSVSAGFRSKK